MNIKLPTDEEIQKWGEDYANVFHVKDEKPLSPWWKESEAFINGARTAVLYIEKQLKPAKCLRDMSEEEIDEWIKITTEL